MGLPPNQVEEEPGPIQMYSAKSRSLAVHVF
jgi:hypothetical protein